MIFERNHIISRFPWLAEKNHRFIISADYDGIICAALLHHHLNWELCGYYDLSSIWIDHQAISDRRNLIWVDLNILPRQGRAVGGHIISLRNEVPPGFDSSCNPNILAGVNAGSFSRKYPFSTLIYLLWLYDYPIPHTLMGRLLLLQADAAWLKIQHYPENVKNWCTMMTDYNWTALFKKAATSLFEKRVDELLYPELKSLGAVSGRGKLISMHRKLRSIQYQCNPDWDEDVILNLLHLFARHLSWTPPKLPEIMRRVDGQRKRIPLSEVRKTGLEEWLKSRKVFSYAIPAPRTLNYTTFGYQVKSPLAKLENELIG